MIKTKIIYGCESRGDANSPYLTRYTFFECKLFQVCLHVFHRSDFDDMHDHPWPFASFIVWRGYVEETPAGRSRKYPFMLLMRKATHVHRVELIENKPAVSIVIMGKRSREWGMITKSGWLQWQKYFIKNGC